MIQAKNRSLGFTLVELIVVITILAILGTIAFISLQGYSAQARDSKRISDIQNIKTSLELFSLNTGKYPVPDNKGEVRYDGELVWTQGTVGDNVLTNLSRNLNTKPIDPLTETEYTYSVIGSQTKYELLSIYESDLVSFTSPQPSPQGEGARPFLFSSANAANQAYPRIDGNYNGIYVKTETYYIPTPSIINAELNGSDIILSNANITSQIITGGPNNIAAGTNLSSIGGLTNLTIQAFSGTISDKNDDNKELLAQALIDAYSGTLLDNEGIYKQIVETTGTENLISLIDDVVLSSSTYTSTGGGDDTPAVPVELIDYCESVGWYWVDSETDTMGDGFCISPRIEGGDKYISWGDIGSTYSWTRENLSADSASSDPMTLADAYADNSYGVTYDLGNYSCTGIGNATKGFDSGLGDTIKGRMKYLSDNKTNSINLDQSYIDWVVMGYTIPSGFTIPSIMLSDCIDGTRDLSSDNIYEGVTFAEYSNPTNDEASRINMNKYLLGWAKDSGSHLPSAYSDISAELDDNMLNTSNLRGEYQIACDGSIGDLIIDSGSDRIWLSAVGDNDGTSWGRYARVLGYSGCGNQDDLTTGNRNSVTSARFVVRP